uniref:Acyl_transf_3 domain-containing protein n=1 Tax=Angiostrongylus cantonensis TaxID=6313 RepID=A0A0K0DKG1_ANGCA
MLQSSEPGTSIVMETLSLYREIRHPLFQNHSVFYFQVIYGTLSTNTMFSTLSLHRSYKELTTKRHSQLDVLDIFRVMAILWVITNHTGSEGRVDVLDRLPSADKFKAAVHNDTIFGALLGNSALGVEIFLVLSGLFGARTWFRKADQSFFAHYRAFIIHRVLRLAPSVVFFIYIVTGPLTKFLLPRFYLSMISSCGVSGIAAHLTFLGNWQSIPTCLGYLWYLGLDMQLHIAAPFLLHVLYKRPLMGKITCAMLILISIFLRGAYCTSYDVCHKSDVDIPFISFPGQDQQKSAGIYDGIWEMYARPFTKCGPFILGLLLGTATTTMRPSLSRSTSRIITNTFFALCLSVIYGILPQYWYGKYFEWYNLFYTASFRTIFGIGICGMILAIISRQESKSTSIIWSVLARLTYNTYLLHMPVIYLFNYSEFLQQASGAIELILILPFVVTLSFIASSVFYFFVEAPLGRVTPKWVEKIDVTIATYIENLGCFL